MMNFQLFQWHNLTLKDRFCKIQNIKFIPFLHMKKDALYYTVNYTLRLNRPGQE